MTVLSLQPSIVTKCFACLSICIFMVVQICRRLHRLQEELYSDRSKVEQRRENRQDGSDEDRGDEDGVNIESPYSTNDDESLGEMMPLTRNV